MVTIITQPGNQEQKLTSLRTVRGLLNRIGRRCTEVLVIRDGELLTPDRTISPDDTLIVRNVRSTG